MPSRRSLLHSVGAGLVVGFAGCAGSGQTELTTTESPDSPASWGEVRPDGSPSVVPDALDCTEYDLRRIDPDGEVSWGEADWDGIEDALALRVEKTEYALGDTAEIRMYNLTEIELETNTHEEYLVQLQTGAGWQTIYGYPESNDTAYPFTDDLRIHEPGRTLIWNISLTADGVLGEYAHPDGATVCPELQPGRYRFVFPMDPPALAVAFDVTA